MCRPPALREGATPHQVSGEPGKGWGRPHDHGQGSTWVSQAGSRPGQMVEAGGWEEPGQETVCRLGPPRGHTVLDVDLSPELPSKPPHPSTPFQSCFWGCCPAGNSGGQPRSPSQAPAVPGRWASYWGGQPHSQTPTPHTGGGDRAMRRPADTLPHPDAAGLAAPCPLSTESAGEPAPPGMAFTSQGTAQRRKATAQGGAWGRGRPNEPLKAEICTGWRLFSAAGSNIGDANCSQICFKQRDRTDLKAPWSPRQWVGGFSGEGSPGRALLHTSTSSLCSQAAARPGGVSLLPCSAVQGAVLRVRCARSPGRHARVRSGSSWTSRQDGGEMPSQAARATGSLRSGCRVVLPRDSLSWV